MNTGERNMRLQRITIPVLLALLIATSVYGQEASEKREIAIFALSYSQWKIPPGSLSLVDSQIKDVFINLGRFTILGMSYRLESENIQDFVAKIKELKEQNVEIPETVRFGQAVLTEADFNQLVGSFIVVIPTVSFYQAARKESGDHTAELKVGFTFIDVENAEAVRHVDVETQGQGNSPQLALRDAAVDIATDLQFELRSIPEFQLKTGIIEIDGGNVLLEFGRNMGVMRGDEYSIVEPRILESGYTVKDEIGLLIVKDVEDEISFARLVYSDRKPQIGDQLEEIPRLGFDTSGYVHAIIGLGTSLTDTGVAASIGVRQSTSRGFYNLRPFVGVEVPFGITATLGTSGLVANIYVGGELNWYLWRLQFVPSAGIGIAGKIPFEEDESFSLSHVGGFVQMTGSYLISRDLKVGIDVGYAAWFATGQATSYSGILFGAGVTYKY